MAIKVKVILFAALSIFFISGVYPIKFTFQNRCAFDIWPGILSNAGAEKFPTTGFILPSGASIVFDVSSSWSGRIWGRSHCTVSALTSKFSCLTRDCASGEVECAGRNAVPPATLAELTLSGAGGFDFFDVSLVDGFNLPILVAPRAGEGNNCSSAGCAADLNGPCPSALGVAGGEETVACRSACEAFGRPEFCCEGDFATPGTCEPSEYSRFFKSKCPEAYSYAYDDASSTFTCKGANGYVISFCPAGADVNGSRKGNGSMVYEGALENGDGARFSVLSFLLRYFFLFVVNF